RAADDRPGDGVLGVDRAARLEPLRELLVDALPDAARVRAGGRRRCGAARLLDPDRPSAGVVEVAVPARPRAARRRAGSRRRQGGLRRAPLAVAVRAEPAAVGADVALRRALRGRLHGAQAGLDAELS